MGVINTKIPGENCVLLRTGPKSPWLLFENPVLVLEADSRTRVIDALRRIDELVISRNLYAAGFLSYEAGAAFDPALKVKADQGFPLLWFGLYPSPVTLTSLDGIYPQEAQLSGLDWTAEIAYSRYLKNFRRIKKHIRDGRTYQVNYTFRLRSVFDLDPWSFFSTLAASHDPPHAAFVNTEKFAVCSFSPELFFRINGEILESRPMKGTMPRRFTPWEDQLQARTLQGCPKNRAENVMITDMVRNDLGRVADPGSVHVTDFLGLEKYPTVWQMTSTVRCRTGARLTPVMRAMFPPSSITGAPKSSTMDIIAGLEVSPRRIYTGSIGYIGPDRQALFSVAIRTVLVDRVSREAEYGVGGGIVWDSRPGDEWNECRAKAGSLSRINPGFCLLETMLWTPQGGFHLLGAHLSRLRSSAGYFDFKIDMAEVADRLEAFSRDLPRKCWKIRLTMDRAGRINIQRTDLDPLPRPVTLSPAQKPVIPDNPFLFHKTTRREIYSRARPRNPVADSVILWNQDQEVTESVTANLVVRVSDGLFTPPVRCGLLAGTYRQFLLGSGMVRERIIRMEELELCRDIYLVNSVRGFVRARLV